MWITKYDENTGLYTHTHVTTNEMIISGTAAPISEKFGVTWEHVPMLVEREPEKILEIQRLTTKELCHANLISHLIFSEDDPQMVLLTDAFYSDIYKKVPYFMKAVYVCANSWDYTYFGDTLGLSVVSDLSNISTHTIIINPKDLSQGVNIIFTIPPNKIYENMHISMCCQYQPILIYPSELGDFEMPLDVMAIKESNVYRVNLSMTPEDRFKTILATCARQPISITQDVYDNQVHEYIRSFSAYCKLVVTFVKLELPTRGNYVSSSGVVLYRQ